MLGRLFTKKARFVKFRASTFRLFSTRMENKGEINALQMSIFFFE